MVYYFICGNFLNQLKHNKTLLSSFQLRLWNEAATIFLVVIVFIVVQKHALDWMYGAGFFVLFALLIMSAVKLAKAFRKE